MASTARILRSQCLLRPRPHRPLLQANTSRAAAATVAAVAPARFNSSYAHLQDELPKRQIQATFEDLSPQSSYRLEATLADYLPDTHPPAVLPPTTLARELPLAHHLVYFEPSKRASEMLPDGTNPDHSPGPPFTRRMWAGGRVHYNQAKPLRLDGSRGVCAEFVRSVAVKGAPGAEKLFVAIERRLAAASAEELEGLEEAAVPGARPSIRAHLDHRVRQRLWRDEEEDFGECSIVETRNIVFMRGQPEKKKDDQGATGDKEKSEKKPPPKILKPQHTPDYSHTITPDAKLLFRFSALTFNAHAIHLDPQWSREVEGHRNLLFHGPMTYTFLLTLLQQQLRKAGNDVVRSVEYRNLSPLYCTEPVTFCGKQTGEHKWEVWAQTPEGGVAAKGTVVTESGNIDRANLGQ